ncbi:MAG: UDPGP type 1 family protein, partial [Sedimentisphaerales bacterium]|nr:UDPGP type 1 family protein [Sedimentisphaerales bacterium]
MAQTLKQRIGAAQKTLEKYGQSHLLQFIEELDQEQKVSLIEQIEALDFDMLQELIDTYVKQEPQIKLPSEILPPFVYPRKAPADMTERYQKALVYGERAIAENKVACFTVAGGMGTRLNFDGPKGNVPATPVKNKTLFQVFAETILANERRYNCTIPWYIMTSPINHSATVAAFEKNNYFGLKKENVMMFPQGTMPCFDFEGKILLAAKDQLAVSPDGHGGSLRALFVSGAIEDMKHRGVEFISYFQVDNPLVALVDPMFIGLHAMDSAEMSSKSVKKCDPLEKVGNFTLADGKVTIIEYSDLPEELARKTNADGSLVFQEGSIAIHIISRAFVERINSKGFSMPWHKAIKKIAYVDQNGNTITPDKTNGVKLETFVFDAVPMANASIIYEIVREDEFAPIKNATGVDSLESSQILQSEKAARWMAAAGFAAPRKTNGRLNLMLEISPLFALDEQELVRKKAQLRELLP